MAPKCFITCLKEYDKNIFSTLHWFLKIGAMPITTNLRPFGSTSILLAEDLRQTLPLIPRSTSADKMNACLKNSNLWSHIKTLKLTTNMCVWFQNNDSGQTFSDLLLVIGNGKLPVDSISGCIQLKILNNTNNELNLELLLQYGPNFGRGIDGHYPSRS